MHIGRTVLLSSRSRDSDFRRFRLNLPAIDRRRRRWHVESAVFMGVERVGVGDGRRRSGVAVGHLETRLGRGVGTCDNLGDIVRMDA